MIHTETQVVENIHIQNDLFFLSVHQEEIAEAAVPGQFAELSTCGATLLNKPLSIAYTTPDKGLCHFVHRVVGPGTRALSQLKEEETIQIIGPCGNGFPVVDSPVYAVGGGSGIPPVAFLSHIYGAHITPVLAARTASLLSLENQCEKATGKKTIIATDDGSKGHHGIVTDCLATLLEKEPATIYACGPLPMLLAIAQLAQNYAVDCYACLEAYMGCGIGVCMGCVIPTVRGYERVCKEGPVFNAKDILWNELLDSE